MRYRGIGWLTLALVLGGATWAQDEGMVLMDTSPRLYLSDLVNIERTVQFALQRWLCSRDRETLCRGLLEEWLRSDASDRGQILEFSAVAPSLDQLPEASRATVGETIRAALRGATQTGRPLGEALLAMEVDATTPVARNQAITRAQAKAWLETQELLLSRAVGRPLRIPDDLAASLVERALRADARAMERAPQQLAHLCHAWLTERAEQGDRLVAAALGLPTPSGSATAEPFADPMGLFEVALPPGWARRPDLDPADGGVAFAGPGGPVLAVSAGSPQRDVVAGTRSVGAALSESIARLGDAAHVVPVADDHDLGAAALVRRGDVLLLAVYLRAPGDLALVAVALRLPGATAATVLPDVATLLGSLRFSETAWLAGGAWEPVAQLQRGGDTTRQAAERDLNRVLREALGLVSVHLLGAPTEDPDLSVDGLLAALGSPPAPRLLDPPPDPMGGGLYG